ncbi:MAG: patatin-like phospholipase family protein [Proteobacteria bacterium]|nr:patatin-like phospholipase family protein [Pseudomonadota bacterium]
MRKILSAYFLIILLSLISCTTPKPDFILLPEKPPAPALVQKPRLAIVLSGGGSRALAHAGVLEVLENHNISIDLIVACSAGSMIGALYADDPRANNLKQKIITLNKWDLLDPSMFHSIKMLWGLTGPVQGNAIKLFVQKNIKAKDFNQLQIPLVVVTTDVDKGEPYVIQSGPLAPALHASSAVPMLFSPVRLYGKTLVDGGVSSPVPVEVAKTFSPQVIIAVDISTSPDYGSVNNVYQLAMRSLHISYFKLSQWQTQQADIVIHPEVDNFGMFDDHANEEMYKAGKMAALNALPQIKRLLAKEPA